MSDSTQAEKLSKIVYSTHITTHTTTILHVSYTHSLSILNLGLATEGFHFTTGCKDLSYSI